MPGRLPIAFAGAVNASALVTEADPVRGVTTILMYRFEPASKPAQPILPLDIRVTILHSPSNVASFPQSPRFTGGPIGMVVESLNLPMAPRVKLRPGLKWRSAESLPVPLPRPFEVAYTVTGRTMAGGRPCLKIEKKATQKLPIKMGLGRAWIQLIHYGHTLCVDPATGQAVSHQLHAGERQTLSGGRVTLDYSLTLALQTTRQLPASEVAARVKQAEVIDQVQRTAFASGAKADREKSLDGAMEALAAFRREYPDSPYAPALARIDSFLAAMRRQVEMESRVQSLKGAPAPAVTLKDLAGETRTLGSYRGKVVLLNFFASWARSCDEEAPHLETEYWQKLRDKGVVVVGVDTSEHPGDDPVQKAGAFQRQHKLTYPILVDSDHTVAEAYGAQGLPTNVIIDRAGQVYAVVTGFNRAEIDKALQYLGAK